MTEETLKSYRGLREELRGMMWELGEIRAWSQSVARAPQTLPPPPISVGVVTVEAVEHVTRERMKIVKREMLRIETAIDALPAPARYILRAHYVDGHQWTSIAGALGVSRASLYRLRSGALDQITDNN
ncbi:MAG: DUF1492 domain-containing protein [Oscillospiraceae bacterium]|nr:DUF1492 domain-containing protein [Oscillospiraceae bacterium]